MQLIDRQDDVYGGVDVGVTDGLLKERICLYGIVL